MPVLLPTTPGEAVVTDARFPDRWLTNRQILGLPSDAFRLYVIANAWAVSNRTDGRLDATDIAMMPDPAMESDRCLLLQAGLWTKRDDGSYSIAGFTNVQTTAAQLAQLEKKQSDDRLRKRKPRGNAAEVPAEPRPEIHATLKDRTEPGQARTGREGGNLPERDGPDYTWGSDYDD